MRARVRKSFIAFSLEMDFLFCEMMCKRQTTDRRSRKSKNFKQTQEKEEEKKKGKKYTREKQKSNEVYIYYLSLHTTQNDTRHSQTRKKKTKKTNKKR